MTYVVVGAGPAGVVAAETLSERAKGREVVLIGGEAEPPYSRMAIPYVLTGLIGEAGTYLRKSADHYDSKGIKYVQGQLSRLSPEEKAITLEDGSRITYDKLLIATGSSPIKPPVSGLDLPGVHHCWTLDDARSIMETADKGDPVLLIGAGFIACIILEALVGRGVDLTVVEALDRMVPRMADQIAGNMIKRWCEEKGLRVETSTRVTSVQQDGDGLLKVEMDNGKTSSARLVVVAAGVRPNVGFLEGSGVKVEDGIVVNNRLETSVADIYAAGDCAEGPDFSSGGWSVQAIQPTAVDHGRIAALNMLGDEAPFHGALVMNVLDTVGLVTASFGAWDGVEGGESASQVDENAFRYTRLNFSDDKLVGALSIGRTDHIGVLRGLIETKASLGAWKEKLKSDPNRITEAYIACCQS
ncbi:MAG: FAD-dependent oxidoreductase [Kiloniellales bacterium]|nr:FAD-dependent oxidoreductase [Kiloniellales bacterium]